MPEHDDIGDRLARIEEQLTAQGGSIEAVRREMAEVRASVQRMDARAEAFMAAGRLLERHEREDGTRPRRHRDRRSGFGVISGGAGMLAGAVLTASRGVRQHAAAAVLTALGAGAAAGSVIYSLQPLTHPTTHTSPPAVVSQPAGIAPLPAQPPTAHPVPAPAGHPRHARPSPRHARPSPHVTPSAVPSASPAAPLTAGSPSPAPSSPLAGTITPATPLPPVHVRVPAGSPVPTLPAPSPPAVTVPPSRPSPPAPAPPGILRAVTGTAAQAVRAAASAAAGLLRHPSLPPF